MGLSFYVLMLPRLQIKVKESLLICLGIKKPFKKERNISLFEGLVLPTATEPTAAEPTATEPTATEPTAAEPTDSQL